jgi:Fe-S-cluster containining protein
MSGSLPTRVVAILAANLAGACPNLQGDFRCGIYHRRPLVCRIYPAEINPFVQLDPANKACPPEAWAADRPLLQRRGRLMDAALRRDIQESRDTDARTVEVKRRLCAALHLGCAALADEGFVVYSPERPVLLAALDRAADDPDIADSGVTDPDAETADASWRFVSNRPETIESLSGRGAVGSLMGAGIYPSFEYLGFRLPPA